MRKTLFLFSLWFAMALMWTTAAATLTMTDGSTVMGDIVKFDDAGILLRSSGDSYTNLPWAQFSQETLKQLSANQKIRPLVEVFIEPDASQRPARAETNVNPVKRMELPQNPSLFGGFMKSPVGLAILLVLYLANLYAAFEVAILRGRPALQVMGVSALVPIIAPAVFLAMPTKMVSEQSTEAEAAAPQSETGQPAEEIQIVEASWRKPEEKKSEPQVFARGKFTFNKKFIETKFANYLGVPKGDALKFAMEVKTGSTRISVERIAQVGPADVIFETPAGQVTVALSEIREIKLNPKTA